MWKWFVLFSLNIGCTFETYHPVEFEDDMAKQKGKITGWAGTADLVTGRGVNAKFSRFPVQAELEEEGSLTTQFNLIGPTANCRAEIISLVNGNAVRRVITVIDGASITTRGKNINVRVGDFTDSNISSGEAYQVAVLSTLGIRAGFKQPPYLIPLTFGTQVNGPFSPATGVIDISSPGSVYVPVPENAGVNSVFVTVASIDGTPVPQESIRVFHLTPGGGLAMNAYDPRNYDWVPLGPNTTIIQIFNSNSSPDVQIAVTFGIDG